MFVPGSVTKMPISLSDMGQMKVQSKLEDINQSLSELRFTPDQSNYYLGTWDRDEDPLVTTGHWSISISYYGDQSGAYRLRPLWDALLIKTLFTGVTAPPLPAGGQDHQ